MQKITINKNGKKDGWDFGCGIRVFYENGVATKIRTAMGDYDFNDKEHAMYVCGINSDVSYGLDGKFVYIYENTTFDIEFLKRIMPYKDFTYNNKTPKEYTFFTNEKDFFNAINLI
jgi:hypothetical protein